MNECIICREEILIAVELTCFECYRKNSLSCSSFCRVCRKCAHDYLQLDRPVYRRELFKRCFYCRAHSTSFQLNPDSAYRKDYAMIRADLTNEHRCPYCHEFQGTQLSIDQHMDTTCPDMVVLCACEVAMPRKHQIDHFPHCSERHPCTECSTYLLKEQVEDHMTLVHQRMKCMLCDEFIVYHDMTAHLLNHCTHRMVRCDYCSSHVAYHRMASHMTEHEQYFESMFQRLMRTITNALRDYNHFRRVRNRLT